MFLAHNISTTTIEVLPRGVSFISGLCGVTPPPPPPPLRTAFNLGRNGDLAGAPKLVASTIADMLLPTNANATGGGVTGTTKKFSPFGGVDTKVYMTPNSATTQTAPAGSAVTNPPSTIVKTQGGLLVANVKVHFSVTGGGGTVAGDTAANVTTGSSGVATVSNWVINAGSNTVQAVGTYVDPSVTFAQSTDQNFPQTVTVDPTAGITFTATGGNVVPYGSMYQYAIGGYDFDPGFQTTTQVAWSSGRGAFGTAGTSTCPIFSDTDLPLRTAWGINTDLLLQTTFPLPSGWNKPLTISAAIDNDVIMYVNGHPLTVDGNNTLYAFPANGNYSFDPSSGFVKHENCATKDELTFTVPAGFLVGGQNLLAIRARDRGGVNYIDLKVTAPTPQ